METKNKTVIAVFIGSVRNGRMCDKVANWIVKSLEHIGYLFHLIDPLKCDWLLTLKMPNQYNPKPSPQMQQVHEWLKEYDERLSAFLDDFSWYVKSLKSAR